MKNRQGKLHYIVVQHMKVFGIHRLGKPCTARSPFGTGISDNDCVGNGKEMRYSNRRRDMT